MQGIDGSHYQNLEKKIRNVYLFNFDPFYIFL